MTATPTSIPFSRLVATDAINARASTKDGLDELAASIAIKGVIQPLAVRPQDGTNRFEVIDGRRRFQALAKLVKAGTIAKTYVVPIHVRNETDAEALETSLMANTVRLGMHPVEQFEVFARLADGGANEADIAARFGIAERTVRQQLALGRLAPQIRNAWRNGKLDAEAAKAYAGSGADHAAQAAHYDKAKKQGQYALSQHAIRSDLSQQRTPAKGIPQRTLDLYVERGGKLTDDLFEDGKYVDDALLLTAVRCELAAGLAETLKAEGWGWVAMWADLPRGHGQWPSLDVYDPTPEEQAALDATENDVAYEAMCLAMDLKFWTAEQKASAGAIINIEHDGTVMVSRGVLRPASADTSAPSAVATANATDEFDEVRSVPCPVCNGEGDLGDGGDCQECDGTGTSTNDDDLPPVSAMTGPTEADTSDADPYAISGALMETITTAQTNAAADALRHHNGVYLVLRLTLAILKTKPWGRPIKLSATPYQGGGNARGDFADVLARLKTASADELSGWLAAELADAMDLRSSKGQLKDDTSDLIRVLDPDAYAAAIRSEFNAADYFKRATKATSLAAIDELTEAGHGAGLAPVDILADMKKANLAEAAAVAADRAGWLPPQLRHPAYTLKPAQESA